ncbi:MAG: LLM class flavin-dependent oxidoreductase, partial [Acidimicrobiales bacterium]
LALGVGSSPWPEDYQLCDVPWEGRGRRMDEAVDIVQGLSAGGYFEYHGEVFDLPPVKMSPTPTAPLPILIGGHAPAALRRAARTDGWVHGGGDPADLPGLLERLRHYREEAGTADRDFEVHVISLDAFSLDGVRRLEEQGVTDVIVGFRWPYSVGPDTEALQTKIDNLRRFADDVIAKARS